ncbi:heterokaryon incompatibility protein-domain-containing protein [Exophiala viscosa]|uniref:heterokaryon incompatibility protein-domain-containing protein n=1 Tax=Exophiala viscosa TaxID=2486360 RepID=UPI00219DADAB|nr:heterokaryon incompatibility protein-domain-containing protein [Exophiala viscosa]
MNGSCHSDIRTGPLTLDNVVRTTYYQADCRIAKRPRLVVPEDCNAASYVEYTIDSRDQGSCSHPNSPSYSWFEALVQRRHDRNNLRTIRVCDNRVGNPEFHKQTPERWTTHHPWGVNWKPWLSALQPGDVIQLVPRAMYPAWLNVVREAQIELGYEVRVDQPRFQHYQISPGRENPLYSMPLDPRLRQIRLLAVQPGVFDDPINCEMLCVQLDGMMDAPVEFEAVSYVCGPPEDGVEIGIQIPATEPNCDEGKLSITRSAEAAIRHLRHFSDVVKLWVDVVCINQDDLDERAQKVRIMATIFSRARIVHIWLGWGHQGIEAALRIIRDAYNSPTTFVKLSHDPERNQRSRWPDRRRRVSISNSTCSLRLHWKRFGHHEREYSGGIVTPHVSKLMSHLFDNAWFRRVWVIQEVLKSRGALVHCGTEVITWKELTTVNSWLASEDSMRREPQNHASQVTMPRIWSRLSDAKIDEGLADQRRPSFTQPQAPNILDVFVSSLDLKATDPRDKIFAISSLGRDTCIEDKLSEWIRPNYEKSESQVFADFTRWWIFEHKSLSILSLIHSHRSRAWQRMLCDLDRPSLPKPSWAVPFEGREKWYKATLEAQFGFRATGNTVPDKKLLRPGFDGTDAGSLVINLVGYKVDDIQDIKHLSLQNQNTLSDSSSQELLEAFHKIFDPSNIEGHWKTSTASDCRADFRAQQAQTKLGDHVWSHRAEPPALDPFVSKAKGGAYESVKTRSVPSCTDPCLFTTSNGMLGLCPWTAKKGDTIALLLGGNVPYLLRRQSNTTQFSFIGECFVLGIMEGELLREKMMKAVQPEAFALS